MEKDLGDISVFDFIDLKRKKIKQEHRSLITFHHTLLNLQAGGRDSDLLKYGTKCIKLLTEDICFAEVAM